MSGRISLRRTSTDPTTYDARGRADQYSLPRLPPQSILHCEDVPHSPLNVGAFCFAGLFLLGIVGLLILLYYASVFFFGVVV